MNAKFEHDMDITVYSNLAQHISDELDKLDLILLRRIHEFRLQLKNSHYTPANQHLYISNEEIDWLLQEPLLHKEARQQLQQLDEEIIQAGERIATMLKNSDLDSLNLPLLRLIQLFNLSPFEAQVLFICLAPELRRKYDRIYAYLQDDITRKRPSISLVLDLLCGSEAERWKLHHLFTQQSVLIRAGILQIIEDPQSPSGSSDLSCFLKLDPRILDYVLGSDGLGVTLHDIAILKYADESVTQLEIDPGIQETVSELLDWYFSPEELKAKNLLLHLYGPQGVGKQSLALSQCQRLNCNLLCLDITRIFADEAEGEQQLRLAFRESMLLQAPLYIHSIDILFADEYRSKVLLNTIERLVEEYGWLTFLAGQKIWQAQGRFKNSLVKSIQIPMPDFSLRKKIWQSSLSGQSYSPDDNTIIQLASQFRLTLGQIKSAADTIKLEHDLKPDSLNSDTDSLLNACRNQSNQKLRELAIKIEAQYEWNDLILPDNQRNLLQQICEQVRQHYKVFSQWGFAEKLAYGKGLSALFSGPPGTGKTMAAQVIANEIKLDLYKVDLSSVISKYIGETEKNLSQIFKEAETSNAILFFDEADALFGKRTEVNDAHDRYANIEVSYLLQKMEEYNGIVILASNLRMNMDDAFVRRIRFIIEFPFPDETSRKEIWKIHFPERAPVADNIDYTLLAKQFAISGGNIKNVILNAAFHAARVDETIDMQHILEGTRYEYEKIGKLWSAENVSNIN